MWKYNRPLPNLLIGTFFYILLGLSGSSVGFLIVKCMFTLIIYQNNQILMRKTINNWILAIFLLSIAIFIGYLIAKKAYSTIGENITLNIRKDLYTSILKKHLGWHDNQNNSAGILSTILASDVL